MSKVKGDQMTLDIENMVEDSLDRLIRNDKELLDYHILAVDSARNNVVVDIMIKEGG